MNNKKTLHIVRHAKSSWDYNGISDIDRPLKLRGIKNAYEMARRVKIRRKTPEILLSSPATRALHTATIFVRVFEISYNNLVINGDIYASDTDTLLGIVRAIDSKYNKAMIFGHNPEFTYFANYFSKESNIDMPTCGVVTIDFDTDSWQSVSKENVISSYFDYPKKDMQVESL